MPDELNVAVVEKKKRRGRGEGGLFRPSDKDQKGSKNWYVSFYSGGRQTTESSGSPVRSVAVALLQRRLEAVRRGAQSPQKADKITLGEILEDVYVDYAVNEQKTLADAEARARMHLLPFFGENTKAVTIKNGNCQKYILHRTEQKAAPSTIANELALLRRAFNLAEANEKIDHAPNIVLPSGFDNAREGFLLPEQFRLLMSNLPEHVRPILATAYFTGCRRGELENLEWSQVDLRAGIVRLSASDTKTASARVIPLAPEPLEILRARKQIRDEVSPEFPYVFFRPTRKHERKLGAITRLGDFRIAWGKACKASGLEGLVLHDNRRSFCRNALMAGIPESFVMKMSGHKTRSILDRYAICSESNLISAAQRISEHVKQIEVEVEAEKRQVPQLVAHVPQLQPEEADEKLPVF